MGKHHGGDRSPTREELERMIVGEMRKPMAEMTREELEAWALKALVDERARAGQPKAWLRKIREALGATSDAHALALAKALGSQRAASPRGDTAG